MKRKSLLTIFISAFLIFIAAPILMIGILLGNAYRETILSNYTNQVSESMNQLKVGLEDELKRASLSLSVVANDKELTAQLEAYRAEEDNGARFELSKRIDRELDYLFSFSSDINSLVVFFKDGSHYYYKRRPDVTYGEVINKSWYKHLTDHKGIVHLIGYGDNYSVKESNSKTLSVGIVPKGMTLEESVDLIYLDIFSPILQSIETNKQSNSRYLLYNDENIIISDSHDVMVGNNITTMIGDSEKWIEGEEFINKTYEKHYVSRVSLTKHQWNLLYMEPVTAYDQDLKQFLLTIYIIYLLVALSFSVYLFVFYQSSIRPVRLLVTKMQLVKEGHLNIETDISGPKEIRELGYTFNGMMARINRLIKERDNKEKERSSEEIRALQAQINPHFIYNTLNTIRLMAIMTNSSNIKEMLEAFMKVTELTFRKGGKHLQVAQEIDYLKAYVHIMQARYGSFVEVKYTISNEVKTLYMMKMLLQPFIENAIVHGLSEKEVGLIEVAVYKDDGKLHVTISDNGIGMDTATIETMLSSGNNGRHIGMNNVKRRIELTYGEAYTVAVSSEIGKYTSVHLTLPLIDEMQEDSDV